VCKPLALKAPTMNEGLVLLLALWAIPTLVCVAACTLPDHMLHGRRPSTPKPTAGR
jgi:hypothetical protein